MTATLKANVWTQWFLPTVPVHVVHHQETYIRKCWWKWNSEVGCARVASTISATPACHQAPHTMAAFGRANCYARETDGRIARSRCRKDFATNKIVLLSNFCMSPFKGRWLYATHSQQGRAGSNVCGAHGTVRMMVDTASCQEGELDQHML